MFEEKNMVGFKEEITDILTAEGVRSGDFKKGQMLKFEYEGSVTCIKITRIDRKNGRAWGEHIEPINNNVALSHYGHNIDTTEETIKEYRVPYCTDCEMPVNNEASDEGKKKAEEREENTLEDGTIIE
ncbi:hypothetical protein [Caudoviricetes sp.]|nr:hypothetical protein [Caudoviricetes sp.]